MTCFHTDMSMQWTYAKYMSIKVHNMDIYDPRVYSVGGIEVDSGEPLV